MSAASGVPTTSKLSADSDYSTVQGFTQSTTSDEVVLQHMNSKGSGVKSWTARFNRTIQRTTKKFGWLGGPPIILGIALVVLVNETSPSHNVRVTATADSLSTSVTITDLGTLGWVGLWVGISLACIGAIPFLLWLAQRQNDSDSRPAQIQALTQSLTTAINTISSINSEVEEGQRVLAELQSRTANQRQLAKLTSEESEAVRNLVGNAVRSERRFAVTSQAVVGVIAGIIAGFLLAHL